DDMPGHAKSSLLGCSLAVPIRDGRLCLGAWQGIFLCEHRRRSTGRRLMITLQGELLSDRPDASER
ncbi:MAG TPA: YjbQ family protein, partial [Thermoguttaceae bacterium]|nr:YjbQ family protein [Thermoguttaceae bacterium]